ncbi:MAG: hypothetical protein JXA14_12030, partial [Anaerolineae bacterium]|nr:hypothetical protein [Anaerolineae bacterium]
MPILKGDVSRRMPDGRIVPPERLGGAIMPSELGMEAMQRMKAARRSRLLEWRRDARERWWRASRAPFDVGKYLLIEVA